MNSSESSYGYSEIFLSINGMCFKRLKFRIKEYSKIDANTKVKFHW